MITMLLLLSFYFIFIIISSRDPGFVHDTKQVFRLALQSHANIFVYFFYPFGCLFFPFVLALALALPLLFPRDVKKHHQTQQQHHNNTTQTIFVLMYRYISAMMSNGDCILMSPEDRLNADTVYGLD